MFDPIALAIHAHAWGLAVFLTVGLIVNLLLRIKTPAQWVILLDDYPRVHAALELVRALGIQPVEIISAIYRIFTGAPPPNPPTTPGALASSRRMAATAPYRDDSHTPLPPPPMTAREREMKSVQRSLRRFGWLGFAYTVVALAVVFLLGACGIFSPAAAPVVGELSACEVGVLSTHPSFVDFLARSVAECGSDWVALITTIVASKDPALASYQPEARAAKADAAKMSALRVDVEARVGALRAGKH